MSVLIGILSFLIILIILVVAHELAHFVTAKSRGVKVNEFGIGFPPRLWGIQRGETFYSINALPLGGFVKLSGEEDPKAERSLASKGYWTRIWVLASGSLMNLVLPIFIAALAFMIPHNIFIPTMTIDQVMADTPAQKAGLVPGDAILAINDTSLTEYTQMQQIIRANPEKEITVLIKRADGNQITTTLIPRLDTNSGYGVIGILPIEKAIRESFPVWKALPKGASYCWETLVAYKNEIAKWINGVTTPQVSGIVGMTEVTKDVAKAGITPLLLWMAFISINLGIVNLFPLPALDGGRILFVFIEMIRGGRRISPKVEGLIHGIGFLLLIGLMLLVTFSDVSKLITTGTALP